MAYIRESSRGYLYEINGGWVRKVHGGGYAYQIQGNWIRSMTGGYDYEISGTWIRSLARGFILEVSGGWVRSVNRGCYIAQISGNYILMTDNTRHFYIEGSLTNNELMAVVAILFGGM